LAQVQLDPTLPAGQREPVRDVVLMIVRENEDWRFAHAPKQVREWIIENRPHATPHEKPGFETTANPGG
jgi:hypothetical protein